MKLLSLLFLFFCFSLACHAQLPVQRIDSLVKTIDANDSLSSILSCGSIQSNHKNILRKIFIGKKVRSFSEYTYYDKLTKEVFKVTFEEPFSNRAYYFFNNQLILYSASKSFIRNKKAGKYYFDNEKLIYTTAKPGAALKEESLIEDARRYKIAVIEFNKLFNRN